ncbi:hypothetical protein PUNSTDRAFT_129749 [Punctularia strigosozonata HHB-11173 SS5]|uniref:uncharacterized protein n=1 Tax=Punctularia strigosozonata (strain HHB-11173) TaxID=741275 RepID=UPI00044166B3|nr:uncharacterized protein PUNSTDRAFT_129749 [Punctularia strigosozonata HHB-11173 SS5]EIN14108.1 hypothetical protein PUNSTDRAFT_129749 [Punctularia strigosozonata HHB-11173 SS5]
MTDGDFTSGTLAGIGVITAAFGVSALAVLLLLLHIGYSAAVDDQGARNKSPQFYYVISLLVSELVQAVGGILNVNWILQKSVVEGSYCSAQGALKQLGDVGAALANLAICIHTFAVIVCEWRPDASRSSLIPLTVVPSIWVFITLIVVIAAAIHPGYYANTGLWCWISENYFYERLFLEYIWMWTTAFLNVLLYLPVYLKIRGFIEVRSGRLALTPKEERVHVATAVAAPRRRMGKYAMRMLLYPAIYIFAILPIAVVRWINFVNSISVPLWATVLADVCFASSGLLSVLLFLKTRPALVRWNKMPVATIVVSSYGPSYSRRSVALPMNEENWDEALGDIKLPNHFALSSTETGLDTKMNV